MSKDEQQKSLIVVHKGRVVDAIYRKPEIPDCEGNPLIEALPPILTIEQAMPRLAFYPEYHQRQREAPNHIRNLYVQNGMRFFAALDIHLDLEQRFSCLTRIGYLSRNPLENGFWAKAASKIGSLDCYENQYGDWEGDSSWSASGFSILGMSGVGKSRSVLRILNLYPQVIRHSNYQGRNFTHLQLVWLKLECPFDSNPRGLCIQFFKAVDSILGTTYYKDYVRERRLLDQLLADMVTVASNHFIGVLVIDEIQRLNLARSGGADKMLNFFVHLINTIGIPVVLVGTYKAMAVLSGEFSQMRRGTGQGDLIWDRMAKDDQWRLFVESLWRFQYTRKKGLLTPELTDVLYEETQGITDFAVKVYMFAQERAIDSGKEMITPRVIRSVAKDKLGIPREVLNALKYGDKRILERFEDVYPAILKEYLAELPEDSQVLGKITSAPDVKAVIASSSQATPEQHADAIQSGRSEEGKEMVQSPADNISVQKIKARPKHGKKPSAPKGQLPKMVASLESKDGLSAYEALKRAGYIRPAREFLTI
jgi:hypothetical protein